MMVEPDEDEEERKSADKIVINYGIDNILINWHEDFRLTVEKLDKVKKTKILNNKDLYKHNSDYDLYYCGLEEVNIEIDNKIISLEKVLRSGKITAVTFVSKKLDNECTITL